MNCWLWIADYELLMINCWWQIAEAAAAAEEEEEEEEEEEDLLMIIYRRRITNNEIQTMNYKLSVWKRKLYLSQAPLPV